MKRLAILFLFTATALGQVAVHRGTNMAQTEFTLLCYLQATAGQAVSADNNLANFVSFVSDTDEHLFTESPIRLSATGEEPATHLGVVTRYQGAKEAALRAVFSTSGQKRGWYGSEVARDDDPLSFDGAKVRAIWAAQGLIRIVTGPGG